MNNKIPNQLVGKEKSTNKSVNAHQPGESVNSALCKNLQTKSLDTKPMTILQRKKYIIKKRLINFLKKITFAFITSAVVTVSTISLVNTINKDKEFDELYDEATSVVHENTHRTEDREHYWINYEGVADGLAELDGDFYTNLYGVYKSVGWNNSSTINQMNIIMEHCHDLGITKYEDFEDLCRQNGFYNKKGEIELRKYQDAMDEYLENIIANREDEDKNSNITQTSESTTMRR